MWKGQRAKEREDSGTIIYKFLDLALSEIFIVSHSREMTTGMIWISRFFRNVLLMKRRFVQLCWWWRRRQLCTIRWTSVSDIGGAKGRVGRSSLVYSYLHPTTASGRIKLVLRSIFVESLEITAYRDKSYKFPSAEVCIILYVPIGSFHLPGVVLFVLYLWIFAT